MQQCITLSENLVFRFETRSIVQDYVVHFVPEAQVKKMRAEYELDNKVQREFMKRMAKEGHMNSLFPKPVINAAAQRGVRPKGFQIHHIVPLSCGGTNDLSNLMLIDESVHQKLHECFWKDVYQALKEDHEHPEQRIHTGSIIARLPKLPIVMLDKDRSLLMTDQEIRNELLARKYESKEPHETPKRIARHRGPQLGGSSGGRGR